MCTVIQRNSTRTYFKILEFLPRFHIMTTFDKTCIVDFCETKLQEVHVHRCCNPGYEHTPDDTQ